MHFASLLLLAACGGPLAVAPADSAPPPYGLTVGPLVAGQQGSASVIGAPAGAEVAVVASASASTIGACPSAIAPLCLGIPAPFTFLGRASADPSGTTTFQFTVPANLAVDQIRLQGIIRGRRQVALTDVQAAAVLAARGDEDGDGLVNADELRLGTDLYDPDTDDGGMRDGAEVEAGLNPLDPRDDRGGACSGSDDCAEGEWCNPDPCLAAPWCDGAPLCTDSCYGECQPIDWCYSDEGCGEGTHCSVSDGICNSDPSCPACDVCTGTCVDDVVVCASSSSCADDQHCSVEGGDCNTPPGCGPNTLCPDVCYGVCVDDPTVCASSTSCAPGEHCSVEDGDCNSPPGCGPGRPCPAVCYGVCTDERPHCYSDEDCGDLVCTVSLGECLPDPTCPACTVCTGTCVEAEPCTSSAQCGTGTCSTEAGDCNRPPGCGPNDICPDACYGWCGLGASH